MLREAQKISRPLPLISGEVPRFHSRSLWHVSLGIIAKHKKITHNEHCTIFYLKCKIEWWSTLRFVSK